MLVKTGRHKRWKWQATIAALLLLLLLLRWCFHGDGAMRYRRVTLMLASQPFCNSSSFDVARRCCKCQTSPAPPLTPPLPLALPLSLPLWQLSSARAWLNDACSQSDSRSILLPLNERDRCAVLSVVKEQHQPGVDWTCALN